MRRAWKEKHDERHAQERQRSKVNRHSPPAEREATWQQRFAVQPFARHAPDRDEVGSQQSDGGERGHYAEGDCC